MDHRRKWDREEYERKAAYRLYNTSDSNNYEEKEYVQLDYAKPRDYKINFASFRARKEIIGTSTHKSSLSGGFHCSVCDVVAKNDSVFLDHLNSRRHQKHLGRSLKTRRASVQEIRYKLRSKKKELSESKEANGAVSSESDFREEEQKLADLEAFKKAKKNRVNGEDDRELPSELQQVMGFSSFVFNRKK